jgi:hypothetical protein
VWPEYGNGLARGLLFEELLYRLFWVDIDNEPLLFRSRLLLAFGFRFLRFGHDVLLAQRFLSAALVKVP